MFHFFIFLILHLPLTSESKTMRQTNKQTNNQTNARTKCNNYHMCHLIVFICRRNSNCTESKTMQQTDQQTIIIHMSHLIIFICRRTNSCRAGVIGKVYNMEHPGFVLNTWNNKQRRAWCEIVEAME